MGDEAESGNWTADRMPDLDGRVVVVTGANSGIGLAATREFARRNARVVMACRSVERGERARASVLEDVSGGRLDVRECDLADLRSVAAFADDLTAAYDDVHVLCNNAGVMAIPYRETAEGFEYQFGVNYLGHFALTGHLIHRLIETAGEARVVTQTSSVHEDGQIGPNWLAKTGGAEEETYDKWEAYTRSKLACAVFAYELDRRVQGRSAISVACHPGFAATNLRYRGPEMTGSEWRLRALRLFTAVFGQSPERGALPLLRAATDPEVQGGTYYGPDGYLGIRGTPAEQRPGEQVFDRRIARQLWEVSEDLTGVSYGLSTDKLVRR